MEQPSENEPGTTNAPDPTPPLAPVVELKAQPEVVKIDSPPLVLKARARLRAVSARLWTATRAKGSSFKAWWMRTRPIAKVASMLLRFLRAACIRVKYQFVHPPFETHPKYTGARGWLGEFKPPKPSEDYKYALEYAWKKYEEVVEASNTLDDKAKNMMQVSGIVVGIVASLVGVAIQANKIERADVLLLLPAVISFLAALILATVACAPAAGSAPASVRDLLDDISTGHAHDGYTAGSMHCAITGRIAINDWKAGRIRRSIACFCIGLVALFLPLVV